jgi:tetratricopeptide (TPR) repeat protein
LDPRNSEALDRLARLLLAQGQIDEGIRVIEQAEQSQQLSAPLLVLIGDAYLKKGDAVRAEGSYQRALAEQSEQTDAVLGLAQVAQFKEMPMALVHLGRARKMVASSPDTYWFALVALRAGLFEEANGTLLAAIKLKSDDPPTLPWNDLIKSRSGRSGAGFRRAPSCSLIARKRRCILASPY